MTQPFMTAREGVTPRMSDQPAPAEIDIDEAMRISGLSKRTLMRYKLTGKLTARVEMREHTQRQRRMVFRRDEIEALSGNTNS